MSRLIDVDTLRKNIQYVFDTGEEVTKYGLRIVLSILDKTPTVDIERHGHWVEKEIYDGNNLYHIEGECSVCHNTLIYNSNYCPYCGAKMDEVEE